MSSYPVLLIAFNRFDLTEKVFEQIRLAKPPKFFLSVDGPRNEMDRAEGNKIKELVGKVDWDCEVFTLFHENNLGCKKGVVGAITWFFEHVEAGIILEDDCVPNVDFWKFCANMLDKYKNDSTIGHVSGFTMLDFDSAITQNHIVIKHSQIWGWATWKRVWDLYQIDPLDKSNYDWGCMAGDFNYKLYFYRNLYLIHKGKINTWDFQYQYSLYKNKLRAIMPLDNLVQNIGFDERATHTTNSDTFFTKFVAIPLRNHNNLALNNPTLSNETDNKLIETAFKRNIWVNLIKTVKALLFS